MADSSSKKKPLAESAYHSPYSFAGAPDTHPNGENPYAPLRRRALQTLEGMGYDSTTMVERGVVWAEDQDPFGHVMHSQYMHFLGTCIHRVMESYAEFMTEQEYDDMLHSRTVVPVVHRYELEIRRQVKFPDSLIAAYRQGPMEPMRNNAITSLYSLNQQAIVAELKGNITYVDVKTGRPVDIRTVGEGWRKLYEGFSKNAERARELKEKWDREHPKKSRTAKI